MSRSSPVRPILEVWFAVSLTGSFRRRITTDEAQRTIDDAFSARSAPASRLSTQSGSFTKLANPSELHSTGNLDPLCDPPTMNPHTQRGTPRPHVVALARST